MTATLHVCRSCQGRDAVRRRSGSTASVDLRDAIAAMILDLPDPAAFEVIGQECMGPCGSGVRIALTGTDRWGWLFQDLQPGPDIEALAVFLQRWLAAPDGMPGKAERPARLLRKTIGRVPGALAERGFSGTPSEKDDTEA